jgi:hypothetical protein
MDSIPTSSYIPILNNSIIINEEKVKEFKEIFFPSPSSINLIDIREMDYPESISYYI